METKRDFSVDCVLVGLLCAACFIPIVHQHFFVNQEIQPPTPQQQQASVPIAKTDIDSAFDRAEELLKKPLVKCIIADSINYYFMENYKPSEGWQCALDALQNQSR
jgi:hypothetical protein